MIEDDENRGKILQTLAEMQSLTDSALDFARQEATTEETRTVDLAALVESLCADMAELGLAVDYADGGPDRLPYACRPETLKRVFRNLFENAVRYGEAAHVALAVDANEVRVAVSDEGPGVPDADRVRIFVPFVRLEPSRSQETGGIGLGLAIARTIVRAHGGDTTLTDGEPAGSVFTVRLPGQD
jgi:signal transduction histidine kinase